jgi:XTP/dITP diphosphohydrolase
MPQLLIATNNPGKVAEFRDLLADSGWEVVAPRDLGLELEIDETGETYAENARIKAEAFCRASGLAALADDSGLEVDALDGEPGPLHHVLGWDGGDEEERINRLLDALRFVPPELRTARYQAVVAVALPDGRVFDADGTEEGLIIHKPLGENGFGYDPVFLIPEVGKTVAELSMAEKNRISHRALATLALKNKLRELAMEKVNDSG